MPPALSISSIKSAKKGKMYITVYIFRRGSHLQPEKANRPMENVLNAFCPQQMLNTFLYQKRLNCNAPRAKPIYYEIIRDTPDTKT